MRYGFPAITAKSSFWVAILELGGGWSPKDLDLYCRELGIAVPETQEITLPGGDGKFTGKPGSADGEYALDMQVRPTCHPLLCINQPLELPAQTAKSPGGRACRKNFLRGLHVLG